MKTDLSDTYSSDLLCRNPVTLLLQFHVDVLLLIVPICLEISLNYDYLKQWTFFLDLFLLDIIFSFGDVLLFVSFGHRYEI